MNSVQLMGRLVRDPDIRYSQGENGICVARFNLAVNRGYSSSNGQTADFISCVAFGKNGEFVEKYLSQGSKVVCIGSILTGSYTNKDGVKIYTTEVNVNHFEFAESKAANEMEVSNTKDIPENMSEDGFINIPEGVIEQRLQG
jgi:single-strand DNA-binding protein